MNRLDHAPAGGALRQKLVPLVVDLDGTLVRTDLLYEAFFAAAGRSPLVIGRAALALRSGKAALKALLAREGTIDVSRLPYDDAVLALIGEARAQGREVYLASASDQFQVRAVAEHLGLFTGFMASDGQENLAGPRKAAMLVERFGDQRFDYVGNDHADLAVWQHAAEAISVRASPGVQSRLERMHGRVRRLAASPVGAARRWLKLLRVHQYAKNGLLLVPLVTAHALDAASLGQTLLGILAFSLCASSVYLLNDLVDLGADRAHPTKHLRPLASGTVSIRSAVTVTPLLLLAAGLIGWAVSPAFLGVLAFYYALTTAYSFWLKRKMLVDVIALASLYTIRVVAGAVAIDVSLSEWLLGFAIFMFMSLALIKRYVELAVRLDLGMSDPSNRNYKIGDLQIVAAMAAVAGFNAVTVLALYISSPDVHMLYHRPRVLWLLCLAMMYWVGRMLLMAHRRWVPEDPILFAVRDKVSWVTLAACLGVVVVAWL